MPVQYSSSTANNVTRKVDVNSSANEDVYELIDPQYSLSDLALSDITNGEIFSLVSLKKNFDNVFNEMGFSETHKRSKKFIVNFYGPPGTGKTMAAQAIAKEFEKKLLIVDYSQVESKYVGDTPKNLKRIFDFASKKDCVIFFDEADAILSRRVTNMQNATDTSVNQTRSVLLNILNDFEGDLIFATNFISNYDPAFMRRITKHIFFDLPDEKARKNLLNKYIPNKLKENLDIDKLVLSSQGLSGADIEKATLMAAFHASANSKSFIHTDDIILQLSIIVGSKKANEGQVDSKVNVTTKIVSENYVNQQLKKEMK